MGLALPFILLSLFWLWCTSKWWNKPLEKKQDRFANPCQCSNLDESACMKGCGCHNLWYFIYPCNYGEVLRKICKIEYNNCRCRTPGDLSNTNFFISEDDDVSNCCPCRTMTQCGYEKPWLKANCYSCQDLCTNLYDADNPEQLGESPLIGCCQRCCCGSNLCARTCCW